MSRLAALALLAIVAVAGCARRAPDPGPPGETPRNAAGSLTAAVAMFDRGELAAAAEILAARLAADPQDAETAYYLGRVRYEQARYAAAVSAAQAAIDLAVADPGSAADVRLAEYHYWLGRALAERIDEILVFLKLPMAQRIRVAFERAVMLDPASVDARYAMGSFHVQAPASAGGDPAGAAEQIAALEDLDPARAHLLRAQIAERDDDFAGAERQLLAAIAAASAYPLTVRDARYDAGRFYRRQAAWPEALAMFEDVLVLFPGDPTALFELGRTVAESGQRLVRGEEALTEFLAGDPSPHPPSAAEAEAELARIRQHLAADG